MNKERKLSKKFLHKKYIEKKCSAQEIADSVDLSKTTILRYLKKFNIPVRSSSEATKAFYNRHHKLPAKEKIDEDLHAFNTLEKYVVEHDLLTKYKPKPNHANWLRIPLDFLNSNIQEATLCLSVSDTHFGHQTFLPDTFHSTIDSLIEMLRILTQIYDVKRMIFLTNGDIVSGKDVYRYHMLDNIVSRPHWQVLLAYQVLQEMVDRIEQYVKINEMYHIRGTHEENENWTMFLKEKLGGVYLSRHGVIDIGRPVRNYNVLFTHGRGRSDYYPVSYGEVREYWKLMNQYKYKGIQIEEVSKGHSHWLNEHIELEGVTVSVNGGFQRWERSINQRPSGFILYMCLPTGCTCMAVRPRSDIESEEKTNIRNLEFKNMEYYAKKLHAYYARLLAQGGVP